MDFDSPAEAFAAIAALVVGADERGSPQEHAYLFGPVRTLSVFDGLDDAQYAALVDRMAGRLADEFAPDGGPVSPRAADEVAAAARDVLDGDRRLQAIGMARSLAGVDMVDLREDDVLERLRVGLEP